MKILLFIGTVILAVCLVFAITGCSSMPQGQAQADIARTCASITAAEQAFAAAERAGKVSAANAQHAQQWIALTLPVCNVTPEPSSIDEVLYAELPSAVAALQAAAAGHDIASPSH